MTQPAGPEAASARTAVVALVAGGALAFAAARAVELLVVVAVIQAVFIVSWVLGAAVTQTAPVTDRDEAPSAPEAAAEGAAADAGDAGAEATARAVAYAAGAGGSADQPPATPRDGSDDGPDPVGLPGTDAMPGRVGGLVIGALAAIAADIAVSRWPHSALSPMLGILGLAVPAMFAHQLTRGVVRSRVVESLSGIALVIAAVVALPALVQLRHEVGGGHMAAAAASAAAVAVAVGLLGDLLWSRPRFDPDVPRGLTAAVLGTLAGAAAGAYLLRHLSQFSSAQALLYCAGIAAASALVGVATSLIAFGSPLAGPQNRQARLLRPAALALLPVMLVSPAAYVLLLSA